MGYGLSRHSLENSRRGVEGKAALRTVLLASADVHFRARLRQELTAMRWQVREAAGGAEAMALLDKQGAEAMVLDSALPDLEVGEFAIEMRVRHPVMDLLRIDGVSDDAGVRSPRRNELLHAVRQAQEAVQGELGAGDRTVWAKTPVMVSRSSAMERLAPKGERAIAAQEVAELLRSRNAVWPEANWRGAGNKENEAQAEGSQADKSAASETSGLSVVATQVSVQVPVQASIFDADLLPDRPLTQPLPEMVGESQGMLELARLVRLVAPRSSTVLIEGDTGTGKELIAKAVHCLSKRVNKPFVVLNCAAIPEALLEAELFGHTRGAFTGAVQSRTGRIEAAHGGTLFLDEIGEMPLALQAKMLRFLESGELQRVGDNETIQVDVRVVAATHEPLRQRAKENRFRLDLYHRLAVFPVHVPALRDRMEDVLPLASHLLGKMGEEMPVKRLSSGAAMRLMEHDWPGNVRELAHVLERATILAEDRREIARDEIRF
jgi:DNA-binding NtrC family response regulator